MSPRDQLRAAILLATAMAEHERQCAERSQRFAERHERLLASGASEHRDLHERMVAVNRGSVGRHLAARRIHLAHAERLRKWRLDQTPGAEPLMSAMAEIVGAPAALTLVGRNLAQAYASASDRIAEAAQDLELMLGEGPMTDAVRAGAPVVAEVTSGSDALRWPLYLPALADLGVREVIAVPVGSRWSCLGALAVFGPGHAAATVRRLGQVADALTQSVLLASDGSGGFPYLTFFDVDAGRSTLHQAVGMLCERLGCGPADALALLQARAFAAGLAVETVAAGVVRREITLD
ncbi:MAG: ANTAR domain-containing protein [Hamadaea sp.]|nr:ANTAR domain-containing protein [Hamadaea sp.]NUR52670.1 ANTAR domain-containing protein [Hamadaea sp.]NUT07201.1 ANTAR domain-containing protein [Hamadaea sp.]